MMPFISDEYTQAVMRRNLLRQLAVSMLVVLQILLFSHLMSLDFSAGLFVSVLCAMPVILACRLLFNSQPGLRYLKMAAVMFAGGGVGMLLGCAADLGQLGLYGLLSLCQTKPLALSVNGLGLYWEKMQLTPWTYIGMFVGGNLGMLLLEDRNSVSSGAHWKIITAYLICNAGMLAGMVLAEALVSVVANLSNHLLAAGLMVLLMLLGMVVGMVCLLSLSMRIPGLKLSVRS